MSYARFGPYSDVYVFLHVDGHLECCGCLLADWVPFDSPYGGYTLAEGASTAHPSTQEMLTHLARHRTAGHRVPDGIDEALLADDAENFPRADTTRTPPAPDTP